MRRVLAVVVALSIALPLPLLAQAKGASERIDVILIEVPVNVTDKNGEPIRNLKMEDFELVDQGQKRPITNFEMVDFAARAGSPAALATPLAPAAKRNFMLLFDLSNSAPSSLVRARDAASEFVNKMIRPGDKVSVGTFSAESGFRLLSSFTTDRGMVAHAIETLGVSKLYAPKDPLLVSAAGLENSIATSGGGRQGEVVAEQLREQVARIRDANNQVQTQNVRRTLDGLTSLGRTLDRVAGRKQVILLSEGFNPKLLQGRSETNSQETVQEQAAIERGEVWKVDNENRFGSSRARNDLSEMVDALRRSDVVMHAVDIKGLRTDVDPLEGQARSHSVEALHLLTRDTGGEVFRNTNNLGEDFARMLKAQDVTYILGFRAPASTPGKFHELKVRVPGVSGAKVSHRVGYYEPSAVATNLERIFSAGEIIMDRLPVADVKLSAFAVPFPRAGAPAQVPVVLEIDGRSLIEGAKNNALDAEVFIYAFDSNEMIRDFVHQKVGLDLGKLREKLTAKGVKFYHTLRLDPGDYSIRTLVRTGGGTRNGFQNTVLHVPAVRETYVAPPVVFDNTPGWVMVKAPDREANVAYPFQIGETSFIPSVKPALAAGTTYNVALFTYNVPTEELKVSAQLEDAAGAAQKAPLKLMGRTSPDAEGGVKLLFELAPPQLARGNYTLTMNVLDKQAKESRVSIPFEVN